MATEETKPGEAAGGAAPQDKPRIHVDSDWKRQAQAEKERLARQVEQRQSQQGGAPAPGPRPGAGAEAERPGDIPPATLTALIQTLATQAAIFMSDERDSETGESLRHMGLAKHNIDLLGVLEEKTRGNLSEEEKRLLDGVLYELRMAYISATG
jgi:hypothetical protein